MTLIRQFSWWSPSAPFITFPCLSACCTIPAEVAFFLLVFWGTKLGLPHFSWPGVGRGPVEFLGLPTLRYWP